MMMMAAARATGGEEANKPKPPGTTTRRARKKQQARRKQQEQEHIDRVLKRREQLPRRPLSSRRPDDIAELYKDQPEKLAASLGLWARSAALRREMDEEEDEILRGYRNEENKEKVDYVLKLRARPIPSRRVEVIMELYKDQPEKQVKALCLWARSASLRMQMDEGDEKIRLRQCSNAALVH